MPGSGGNWIPLVSTFGESKVAEARLPFPCSSQVLDVETSFFVVGGDILDDRLVTF